MSPEKYNEDIQTLQKDLNNLQGWSNKWLLRFHPDKCKVMTISRKKKQDQKKYTMRKQFGNNIYTDHILDQVEKEKDLGVTVDCNLSFEHHILEKVSKVNQMMGLIRRSFVYLDTENFTRLYKAIVRPHLEYANSVWMPRRK